MKQGLLIVDVQNDYFKGGKMPLAGMTGAAANARNLLEHFRSMKAPVFHVQHLSIHPGAAFFIPDTAGCEIHESVAPLEGETVIRKHFPNSFRETRLHEFLQGAGVEELMICGAMSHMCIDATTRAAFDSGYSCTVASDACATRDLEFEGRLVNASDVHAAYMAALQAPYAKVLKTKTCIEAV